MPKTCSHLVLRRCLFVLLFRFHSAHNGTSVDDTNVFRVQPIHKEATQMPQHLVQFLHVVLQWVKPHQQRVLSFFVVVFGPTGQRQIGVPLKEKKEIPNKVKQFNLVSMHESTNRTLEHNKNKVWVAEKIDLLLAYRWASLI